VSRPAASRYHSLVPLSKADGTKPRRLLFVCTGNICRSPLAEAIFRRQAEEAGRGAEFEVDSAGTHDYHEGERADPRARRVGQGRGVAVTSIAREVEPADFERFDLILAMDRSHLRELRRRCPAPLRDRIRLMGEWEDRDDPPDVPDPYYSDDAAFVEVFELLDRCNRRLLADLA
jgi:protein-tyrosine phosphatase